jgi:predicted adenylyl cyclase CyaB
MARNLEFKVRVPDLDTVRRRLRPIGARHVVTEEQIDRYYEVDGGRRLKLRTRAGGRAELIRYDRPETSDVRTSDYEVTAVRDTEAKACLVPKGTPRVVVRKLREVHVVHNVRIHLDRVEGLGDFLELEAVVEGIHDEAACRLQIEEITRALGLRLEDCLRASYADLAIGR